VYVFLSHKIPLRLISCVLQASGELGTAIVRALLDSGRFNVSALTRPSSKSIFPLGVRVLQSDYSEASLLNVLHGQDAVICTIGMLYLPVQRTLIDASEKAGVKRFVPSEFGENNAPPQGRRDVSYLQTKWEMLEYLRRKCAVNPEFTYTAIATGPFFGVVSRLKNQDFTIQD
jgi:uncharacterized protein YbjT (DUF2867 family)